MSRDGRATGSPDSDTTTLAAGDGGTNGVVSLREEEVMSVSMVRLQYSSNGTTQSVISMYDEAEGTAPGDLSDKVDEFHLSPGDEITIEEATYRDIEDDVLVEPDGNQDAEIVVTIGGYPVTG